ncbi:MAG: c-type cytochrome [bacterium]|nr:c-type cytochrome [bacterium]
MRKFLTVPGLLYPALLPLALLLAATAVAGDEGGGEKLDGKKLFKERCKTCHGADAPAGEYTPMFLIQEQWTKFFAEDYAATHKGLTVSATDTTKVLDAITPEMLEAIRAFCHEGAADSEHPMTCG